MDEYGNLKKKLGKAGERKGRRNVMQMRRQSECRWKRRRQRKMKKVKASRVSEGRRGNGKG